MVLINTARGGVVDEGALLDHLRAHPAAQVMIDVWQGEPHINAELLARARIATPHIAGYSRPGRRAASRILRSALARGLSRDRPGPFVPADPTRVRLPPLRPEALDILSRYDVRTDTMQVTPSAQGFQALRRDQVLREEFTVSPLAGMPQAV